MARRRTGRLWICGLLAGLSVTPAGAQDAEGCLFCHRYRGLSRYDAQSDRVHLFFVDEHYWLRRLGPHARLACTDCHERSEVMVVPHKPVRKVDCTRTCHLSNPQGLAREFSHQAILEQLDDSAHAASKLWSARVSGEPLLEAGQSACLFCHDQPVFRDPGQILPRWAESGTSALDRCDVCHSTMAPKDVAYALRHIAARLAPARPPVELAQTCAVCHSDPTFVQSTGLHDAVASYARSFHGKAVLLGDERAANCLSCHAGPTMQAHGILPPDDPRSSVHADRLATTCRSTACHPGADPRIARASVHLDLPAEPWRLEYVVAAFFVLLTTSAFVPWMTLTLLELLDRVIPRRRPIEAGDLALAERLLDDPQGRSLLVRYTPFQRVQHWYLAVMFIALAVTGLPQRYAEHDWAGALVQVLGGLELARSVHHVCGVLLAAGLAFHVVYVLICFQRRRRQPDGSKLGVWATIQQMPMWLTLEDLKKTHALALYFLRLRARPPEFDRFSLKEKFGYMAVFWGTVLLGLTGALLWGEQVASHYISGRLLNIALIAHSDEAYLAVSYIGLLHIVDVTLAPHSFPLSAATLTGHTPAEVLALWHRGMLYRVARQLGIPLTEAARA